MNSQSFAEGVWFPTNKPNCEIWNPQPQDDETAFWSGECLDGKAHGEGALTWKYKQNDKYIMRLVEGKMTNGRHKSQVKITYENGDVYIGELNGMGGLDDAPGMGHRVGIYDLDGNLVSRFGDSEEGDGPGQFFAPHGIAVDSEGSIYVSEVSYTIRGSRMDPPRELRSISKYKRV